MRSCNLSHTFGPAIRRTQRSSTRLRSPDRQANHHADRQLGLRFQWLSILGSLTALTLAVLALALNVDGLPGILLIVVAGVVFLIMVVLLLINLWRADRLAGRAHNLPPRRRGGRNSLLPG